MKIHGDLKNSGQEQGTALTLTTKTYKMYFFVWKKFSYTTACENFIMKLEGEDAKYTSDIKMFCTTTGRKLVGSKQLNVEST